MASHLKNFIKDRNVASVTSTSLRVVRRVCEPIDFSRDITVIEYGPGDGVFSRYLLDQMSQDSRLIMIETNEDFVSELKQISDDRAEVIQDSAENVESILDETGIEKADYIISGIPFSFLKVPVKHRILKASRDRLADEGLFLAYQTSKHLKPHLEEYFFQVETHFSLMNLPPMCIYKAKGYAVGST